MSTFHRDLFCPKCRRKLKRGEEIFSCTACGKTFRFEQGIPIFLEGVTPYEDETSKRLYKLSREKGWDGALLEAFGDGEERFWYTSIERGNGLWLSRINSESTILDLGCGTGVLSLFASKIAKLVYAVDPNIDRVRLLKLRVESEGISNIVFAVTDEEGLPFENETFDLIILNGVLEWIPEARGDKDPSKVAKETMANLSRLLRPDGEIYIGIENRYGLRYLLGRRDEHTGLRMVTVLPRRVSDIYHRWKKGVPYRRYTYSLKELKRMARGAGLECKELYMPLRDYREVKLLVDLRYGRRITFVLKKVLGDYSGDIKDRIYKAIARAATILGLTHINLQRYFTNCYSIIFGKKSFSSPQSELKKMALEDFIDLNPFDNVRDISLVILGAFKTNTVFVFDGNERFPVGVLRVESNRSYLGKEFELLRWLKKHGGEKLNSMLNNPIRINRIGSVNVVSYPYIPSPTMVPSLDESVAYEHLAKVSDFIYELSRVSTPDGILDETLPRKIEYLSRFNGYGDGRKAVEIKGLYDTIKAELPFGVVHGDLNFKNIFFSKARFIVHDWEFASTEHPFFDWIHFVVYYASSIFGQKDVGAKGEVDFARECFFGEGEFFEIVREFSKKLLFRMDIKSEIFVHVFFFGLFIYFYKENYYRPERFVEIVDLLLCEFFEGEGDLFIGF